jgi:putative redox protein
MMIKKENMQNDAATRVTHEVTTLWKDGMHFVSAVNDHEVMLDAAEQFGGAGKGPRPKELMLAALTGCTGMDVVSLLNKMRVPFKNFSVLAKATLTDEHPKYYDRVHLIYRINASENDREKIEKAINLSQEKYCGVSFMFKKFAEVSYELLFSN